ncbi:MAG: SCO family protein, partial [Actinomycetota bacterium]
MTDLRPEPTDATEPGPADGHGSTDPSRAAAGGRPRRLILTGAVLGAVGLGLVVALAISSWFRPHLYAGTVLQGDEAAPSLAELSYADGTTVDLGAYEGEVVLVFFGYTNCPDICPTTMADAAGAMDLLDDGDAERTNLLMVSVDPDRDPVGTVDEYAGFFNPAFRGAGGPV